MMTNKHGQLYIFTAIVLIALASGIVLVDTRYKQTKNTFFTLSDNFLAEVPYVVSSARVDGIEPIGRFTNYSDLFFSYARTADPGFGMAVALQVEDKMVLVNYLGTDAKVEVSGVEVPAVFNATIG